MTDLASLRAQVNVGLGRAAAFLGSPTTQYRPADPLAPLASTAIVGTVQAAFDETPAFRFVQPAVFGETVFQVLADTTTLAVGDYLSGPAGTFFIIALEDVKAAEAVRTSATISAARPVNAGLAGANPPGGDGLASETTFLLGWPASMLAVARGDRGDVNLPGDVRMGWWQFLLPQFAGVDIRSSDIIVDQNSVRHVVMSAEATPLGWRITAEQEAS